MSETPAERRVGLCLKPLDTLFFRDGRPFDASARVLGGLPTPQTLAGALRTALLAGRGFDFRAFAHRRRKHPDVLQALRDCRAPEWIVQTRFRGPWLALQDERGQIEPLLPVPQTLVRLKKDKEDQQAPGLWDRAAPLAAGSLPGWRSGEGARLPLWRKGMPDAKHPGGFLTLDGIRCFLQGGKPDDRHWLEEHELFGFDLRTGIAVNAETLTAAESQIYGIRLLALRGEVEKEGAHKKKRVCLYAEALLPSGAPKDDRDFAGPLPLGGEGRHAVLSPTEATAWEHPSGAGGLWLLATPGLFGKGRSAFPDRIPRERLCAAASASPLAVSGWDVARGGPKATRFAVPAGAVYFVDENITLPDGSLCGDDEDAAQGWGFALPGVWKP
jgi:CRISPR-associated protein Cmr3